MRAKCGRAEPGEPGFGPSTRGRAATRGAVIRLRVAARLSLRVLVWGSVAAFLALGVGPHTGRYRTLTVLSDSMAPAMPAGSLAIVTPQPASSIRVGQIVTYQIPVEDRRVVSHRVVEVLEEGPRPVFRTKGDGNEAPDPWTARVAQDTVWRVRVAVPHAGRVVSALRAPALRRVGLVVASVLLALAWLARIWSPAARRLSPRLP